jgi:hypothetical protein
MRQGILQNVGGVWYERIYTKNDQDDIQKLKSFTTLFQGPLVVEKKVIAVLGFSYNGYIVRRVADVLRYLPTKDEFHCKRIVSKLLVKIKWLTNRCM